MRIVYKSFSGRYSDSPAAVHRALAGPGHAHEHVWLSDPRWIGSFPPGTSTRDISSPAAIEALESADLVLADSHIELEWDKRPGTTYVQTWHGTPLKRVHTDILSPPPGVLERLSRDVDRWDVLVSPNRYGTGVLRGAFSWQGPVLETGLPRNDVLTGPDADRIRERVRHELGIRDGQTAVLYTPTFRDDTYWARGADAVTAVRLDAAALEALGPDHVVLTRLHYMLTGRAELPGVPGVRDVSGYPDVSLLYLAADVMVTDYSSTMFDFAVTGKPLVFYAYDLEYYRDEMRGFYFDLSAEAPGPVVSSQAELVGALHDVTGSAVTYAEAYARFRETFCHLDDGHATERLLKELVPAP